MSKNLTTTPEQAFNYLKRYDVDFKQMKEDSEHRTWSAFKDAWFSDPDLVKWLESKILEINEIKCKNYSKVQIGRSHNRANGIKNVESGHLASLRTTEHQRNAGEVGREVTKNIREERLISLFKFMIENLPQEFSKQDFYNLRNNNLDNTLFHKSHKQAIPMTDRVLDDRLDKAIKMKLIKKVQSGNQHCPTMYHIINTLDSVNNSNNSYESVLEYHFGV